MADKNTDQKSTTEKKIEKRDQQGESSPGLNQPQPSGTTQPSPSGNEGS